MWRPAGHRGRARRCHNAIAELIELQAQYAAWSDKRWLLGLGIGGWNRSESPVALPRNSQLDPVEYRLEQISSSGIGQQALSQALCFSQ
jgi:hypothetical protein